MMSVMVVVLALVFIAFWVLVLIDYATHEPSEVNDKLI